MDFPAWQAAEAASTAATVMNSFILGMRTRVSGRGWSHVARVSAGLAEPRARARLYVGRPGNSGVGEKSTWAQFPGRAVSGLTTPSLPHQHTTKYDAVSSTGDLEQSFPSPSHKIPNHKMQRLLCLCLLFSRCPLTADWRIWRWDYCVFVLSVMCPGAGHGHGGCRSNWISYLCDHHHETTDNWSPRGDKKLCVFQNRQSVDFTDVMGEIYFVAVHIIVAILQGISSYILWSNLILLKASPGSRLKIIALLCK